MIRWSRAVLVLATLTFVAGCTDKSARMKEAQKKRNAEKEKFEKDAEERRKAAAPRVDAAKLDAFWDGDDYLKIATGKKCPEGLWALFPSTPGEGSEKEANEKKKAALAEQLKGKTFVAVFHHGLGVDLKKYDKKKKVLPVQIEGVLECFDGLGLLTVALGDGAKPLRPSKSKGGDDELSPQAVWRAKPLIVPVPFESAVDANAFAQHEGTGTEARLVFTLGKVEVDEKLEQVPPNEEAGTKGGTVDWGAGRLVHAELKGIRVASDHEKHLLAEQRPGAE